jgi:HD-like signal output (HDOD) protein
MGQVSLELSNRLSAAVERMPAFPRSVHRILELTRDINCLPKDLVAVIEKDPVIAIKILKIVNSAYYSLPNRITSINHSVLYLGINTVKNLALSFATVGILPRQNAARFDIQHYLMHSLLTANAIRLLVNQFADDEAEANDSYIVGLLHDFGKVVFAQFMPQEFRQAMTLCEDTNMQDYEAEEQIIGADHALVGAMLAKRWQFPDSLVECIGFHHQDRDRHTSAMGECLYVADLVATQLCIDEGANLVQALEAAALPERFGDDIDNLLAALGDIDKLTDDAALFCQGEGFT